MSGESKAYKIGEAAELLGLKTYVLRFWETEFPQLKPKRSSTGQRVYTQKHIEMLRTIQHLLHEEGLTIDGARKRLKETMGPPPEALIGYVVEELEAMRRLLSGATKP
jgi:DNA-binding transcriptional MerR regulator